MKEIKSAYSNYANGALEILHFNSFWTRYISEAQRVYNKEPFNLDTQISGSVFTSRDILTSDHSDILTSDYFHKLNVSELKEKSSILNSFIRNYSLIRFYLLFEDYIYQLLWITDFYDLKKPTNELYKSKIKNTVIDQLKSEGILKRHKNNDFIHAYLKHKYSGNVKNLLDTKVSFDFDLNHSNLLELLTKLRHTNSHNIAIDKQTLNGLKSDKSVQHYLDMILELDETGDMINLKFTAEGLRILINHTGILLTNLTRLIFKEDDFKFLGLDRVIIK